MQFIQNRRKKDGEIRRLHQSVNQVRKQQPIPVNSKQSIGETANQHKNVMFSEIFQNTQIIRFASVQFNTRTHNKSNST